MGGKGTTASRHPKTTIPEGKESSGSQSLESICDDAHARKFKGNEGTNEESRRLVGQPCPRDD